MYLDKIKSEDAIRKMEVDKAAEFNNALMDEIIKLRRVKSSHVDSVANYMRILKESHKPEAACHLWMLLVDKSEIFARALQNDHKKLITSIVIPLFKSSTA